MRADPPRRSAELVTAVTLTALAALCGFSCSGNDAPGARAPATDSLPPPAAPPGNPAASTTPATTAPSPPASAFTVAVTDRAALEALEARGFSLASLVFGAEARTTAELDRSTAMKDVFAVLRADVRSAQRVHPLAKVTSMDGFRLFDERWLASPEMTLELVGVFNRLDRRVFYAGTCGEVRFVYRLAYRTMHAGAEQSGRLPMTVNAVFLVPAENGCEDVARRWLVPSDATGARAAEWLTADGALAAAQRETWTLKSLETNLQSFRLQSFVHPTLAGHIDYVLRVFRARGGARDGFVPAPLENMPDVALLESKPALRAELLEYLRRPEVLAAIDQGTLLLPERFLATRAVSVSPRALTRSPNRPFRALFDDRDFAGLPLADRRTIASPKALLRRLDEATCTGCHQSRSIAGFHHVGEDAPDHPAFDALFSGSSAHLASDLERRRAYLARVASGASTEEFRPLPERQGTGAGFGAACGLGDPGFADWKCDAGLHCEKLEDEDVGVCLGDDTLGAPCQYGVIAGAAAPHRDRVGGMKSRACGSTERCDVNRSGFPLGSCSGGCGAGSTSKACAEFLDADAFQNCLRARRTFAQCAEKHVFGAGMRACDTENPCRQDYVCVRSREPGAGACVPPYFVYQLRLDGYPIPR